MALETRVEKVEPSGVNRLIQQKAAFGWTVLSTQEMNNTYLSTGFDTIYQNTEKWVNITFQRDNTMKNYSQIAELEREYDLEYKKYKYFMSSIRFINNKPAKKPFEFNIILLGLIFMVVPGILMINANKKIKAENLKDGKNLTEYKEKAEILSDKIHEILEKAKALL